MPTTFAGLVEFFESLGPLLPAILTFINAIATAWHGLLDMLPKDHPATGPVTEKLRLTLSPDITVAEKNQAERLTAIGGGLDGHRIANLVKWGLAHPDQLMAILAMFGIKLPTAAPTAAPAAR